MIGLGFEAKMAAALMVVPGIAAAWLWIAPRGRLVAVRQLLAGGAAMVAVGGAWPLLVSLTPAADRPWISGTTDNSVWSLILGYNGLGRLFGQARRAGRRCRRTRWWRRRLLRRRPQSAATAQREPRRTGRLAAGLRDRRGSRAARADAPAPGRCPHRLATGRRRLGRRHGGGVQPGIGNLPPLLRLAARPVHRGARRRRRRRDPQRRARRSPARPRWRSPAPSRRRSSSCTTTPDSSPGCQRCSSSAGSQRRSRSPLRPSSGGCGRRHSRPWPACCCSPPRRGQSTRSAIRRSAHSRPAARPRRR
jgi:hypothetical protein